MVEGIMKEVKKHSCEWPECPSKWIGDDMLVELKAIQQNQIDQRRVQEKMLEQQILSAGMVANITHAQEDIRKQDARITEIFKIIDGKYDKPKDDLVTKGDVNKMMKYTAGLIISLSISVEIISRWKSIWDLFK